MLVQLKVIADFCGSVVARTMDHITLVPKGWQIEDVKAVFFEILEKI